MKNVDTYEHAFLIVSIVMLVLFFAALGYAAFGMGITLPGRAGEVDPTRVRQSAPFDNLGVTAVGDNEYEAVILAQAWSFVPDEVRVPAGARVTIRITSADVIHGFLVEGTRLNSMVLPGQISELRYTFDEPGEHLIICHEYCGLAHHTMFGRIIVE